VKRALNLLIMLGMILGVGLVQGAFAEDAEELNTFSVLYNQSEETPFSEDWLILKEYETRQHVHLDIRTGDNSDYQPAVIRTLETGNAPDIILKVWPNEIEGYAASGALLPFSDYEDLMPYFMAYVADHGLEDELDKLRLPDGKYYILPGYQRAIQVQQWIYRKDLFDQYNLGVPETYDELELDLEFLKDLYPDAAPLTACWGGAHLFAMMGAGYAIPSGWNGTRSYNATLDRWQFAPATDNYREMLRFLAQSYAAGVLDPGVFSQPDDEYYAKLLDGRGWVSVSWISSGFDNWNQTLQDNGVAGGEWAPLPVPESTIGIRAVPPVNRFRKGLIVPSRVANEPYLEDLLRFLDWAVYSQEGMELTTWGVEGITFRTTTEGNEYLWSAPSTQTSEGPMNPTRDYGLATLFDLNENEAFTDANKPSDIVAFLNRSLQAGETEPSAPALELSTASLAAIDQIILRITDYAADAQRKFITGELDVEADWDTYLLELQQLGYLTLESIWNSAWAQQQN